MAALVAGMVSADTTTVHVRKHTGELVTGSPIAVLNPDGTLHAKIGGAADGDYIVDLEHGQKYVFNVNDPSLGQQNKMDAVVLAPVVDVTLLPPPGALGIPANDDCANAEALAIGGTANGTTIGATTDTAPTCGTDVTAPGVWYSVVGNGNDVTLSTCNTADYDTKINVYCLGCDTLACVDGNDDGTGCSGFTSELTIGTQAGTEYLVLVNGFSGSIGNFALSLTDSGVASSNPVDCTPPPPMGACCNCLAAPFNCTVGTEEACLALTGDPTAFQGMDSECVTLTETITTASTNTPLAIPDAVAPGSFTPLVDTITVPGSAVIAEASVFVDIRHTWVGDLVINVEHAGVSIELWNSICDQAQFVDLITTFDDDGTSGLCGSPTPPPGDGDGNIMPGLVNGGTGFMSDFDGLDCAGDWNLSVGDDFPADTGTLMAWAVNCGVGIENCPDNSPPFDPNDCPDVPTTTGGGTTGGDEDEDEDEGSGGWWHGFCADFGSGNDQNVLGSEGAVDNVRHFASTNTPTTGSNSTGSADDDGIRPRGLRGRTDRGGVSSR
jgi:subtilisin-like proprotein convertase family protein